MPAVATTDEYTPDGRRFPVFLTAEWRNLVLVNWEVARGVVAPLVPRGTELDEWKGRTYLSLVGFMFLKTRVRGIAIPFHRDFEEVNLRFYVRRKSQEGWRRAVVFVKELVPRAAIAFLARTLYNENYQAVPMSHEFQEAPGSPCRIASVSYGWRIAGRSNRLRLAVAAEPQPLVSGSQEEFITEHYWGYTAQRDGGTVEYRVTHPSWRVAPATAIDVDCDFSANYGPALAESLQAAPDSAFLADGSAVCVSRGVRLTDI